MRHACVALLDGAWSFAVRKVIVSFAWVDGDGVWFGTARRAQLRAGVLCRVGRCFGT